MRFNQRLLIAFLAPALLFVAGLATGIGSLVRTQHGFEQYLGTEAVVANNVREMYAQGLQMGQAMRNILLDPQNPTAYKNLDTAREWLALAYDPATPPSAKAVEHLLAAGNVAQADGPRNAKLLNLVRHMDDDPVGDGAAAADGEVPF